MAEDELYRRYAARLLTLCRRYVGNTDDAMDLMHEAMIKSIEKMSSFKYVGEGSLYAWMRMIAINQALNHIYRHRWRFIRLETLSLGQLAEPDDEVIETIPVEKLLEMISSLPDLQRLVFNLYCMDGYSHREIGQMLGITEKGSAGILAKARGRLKKVINNYLNNNRLWRSGKIK